MANPSKVAKYLSRHRRKVYDSMIRVDHSGELGADRIYCGQMFILRNDRTHAPVIQEMWDQEKRHLAAFESLALKHRVRKSALQPLWNIGGFTLGAVTALLGPNAAMACTEAVESVIVEHYNDQIRQLIEDDIESNRHLIQVLSQFRDEEQQHCDTGIHYHSNKAPAYQLLYSLITNICHLSIKIAKTI